MALAFTHTAAGYLAYEAARPTGPHRPALLAAAVAFANGPDLDFLPGLLTGHPAAWHRGVTHTIAGVAAVGGLVLLGLRLGGRSSGAAARGALWAAAAWGSHLLIDFFTADAVAPHGARFLWPLSRAYYLAPRALIDEAIIDYSGRGAFVASLLTPHALAVWGHELVYLVCTVLAVHAMRALHARAATPIRGVAERS